MPLLVGLAGGVPGVLGGMMGGTKVLKSGRGRKIWGGWQNLYRRRLPEISSPLKASESDLGQSQDATKSAAAVHVRWATDDECVNYPARATSVFAQGSSRSRNFLDALPWCFGVNSALGGCHPQPNRKLEASTPASSRPSIAGPPGLGDLRLRLSATGSRYHTIALLCSI